MIARSLARFAIAAFQPDANFGRVLAATACDCESIDECALFADA